MTVCYLCEEEVETPVLFRGVAVHRKCKRKHLLGEAYRE